MSEDKIEAKAIKAQDDFEKYLKKIGAREEPKLCNKFTKAELSFGQEGVYQEFDYSICLYGDNINYFTQLVLVLNLKMKEHFRKCNPKLEKTYKELYIKAFRIMCDRFNDEDLYYCLYLLNK